MKNLQIITYDNKPIYVSKNGVIDWWLAIKAISQNVDIRIEEKDFDEYQSRGTFQGCEITHLLIGYDIKVWIWSDLNNDFIEK